MSNTPSMTAQAMRQFFEEVSVLMAAMRWLNKRARTKGISGRIE